jgi:O-antigen/teichoic acid export membrane protein
VNQIWCVVLRAATLVAKFSLIIALARFLPPAEIGIYGLIFATVGFFLLIVGCDFYAYALRELITSPESSWRKIIRDQAYFYITAYIALVPFALLIFYSGLLPMWTMIWFFPLLALEHIAQEFNRLYIAMSRQLTASAILFVRHGLFGFVIVIVMLLYPATRSLEWVFAAWVAGLFLACVIGATLLRLPEQSTSAVGVDWAWIRRGLLVALPFIVSTLCLRALFTVDRYWIEKSANLEIVAAYVLFFGIANATFSILEAGVVGFMYPRVTRAYKQNDRVEFLQLMRSLSKQTLLTTTVCSIAALIVVFPLLTWLERPIYGENIVFFYWLLAAIALQCVSTISHIGLYAQGMDKFIAFGNISSLLVFVIATSLLIPYYGAISIPIGLTAAFLFLLVFKNSVYSWTLAHQCSNTNI